MVGAKPSLESCPQPSRMLARNSPTTPLVDHAHGPTCAQRRIQNHHYLCSIIIIPVVADALHGSTNNLVVIKLGLSKDLAGNPDQVVLSEPPPSWGRSSSVCPRHHRIPDRRACQGDPHSRTLVLRAQAPCPGLSAQNITFF